jgi:hypothetical protein
MGFALSDLTAQSGWIEAEVTLSDVKGAGRLVFGRDPTGGTYYSAGIGGDRFAYYVDQFVGTGWNQIAASGASENLEAERPYHLELYVQAQHFWLKVDGVWVVSGQLPAPPAGELIGVTAWGATPVTFEDFRVLTQTPEAFVVMQFGEPYDSIYQEVIVPVAAEQGYSATRVDEIHAPGIILQDIVASLVRSAVVIAEITPPNPNVFYELGYAHALGKPTILLAERDRQLPFDVSGYRVIFYDNTIGGKHQVEKSLREHLSSIFGNPSGV